MLTFDGKCYLIIYDFIVSDILPFQPEWTKADGGKEILLTTKDGK